jgi:hypothetical protein
MLPHLKIAAEWEVVMEEEDIDPGHRIHEMQAKVVNTVA